MQKSKDKTAKEYLTVFYYYAIIINVRMGVKAQKSVKGGEICTLIRYSDCSIYTA